MIAGIHELIINIVRKYRVPPHTTLTYGLSGERTMNEIELVDCHDSSVKLAY